MWVSNSQATTLTACIHSSEVNELAVVENNAPKCKNKKKSFGSLRKSGETAEGQKLQRSEFLAIEEAKSVHEQKREVTMEEEPLKYVDVSYKINCISHIDAVTSTYYVDVKLFFHWVDPNFIGRKKNETVDIKTEGSWNPDIIVTNEHELTSVEAHREVKVNNPATGEIKSSIQYRGTLFINVRFHAHCL